MATKALNIILLFSVLLSSTGLLLGNHQCGVSATEGICVCSEGNGCQDNCCHTDWEYFQSDLEKQSPVVGMEVPVLKAVLAALPEFFSENKHALIEKRQLRSFAYRPPIVRRDIPVLFQSFLI